MAVLQLPDIGRTINGMSGATPTEAALAKSGNYGHLALSQVSRAADLNRAIEETQKANNLRAALSMLTTETSAKRLAHFGGIAAATLGLGERADALLTSKDQGALDARAAPSMDAINLKNAGAGIASLAKAGISTNSVNPLDLSKSLTRMVGLGTATGKNGSGSGSAKIERKDTAEAKVSKETTGTKVVQNPDGSNTFQKTKTTVSNKKQNVDKSKHKGPPHRTSNAAAAAPTKGIKIAKAVSPQVKAMLAQGKKKGFDIKPSKGGNYDVYHKGKLVGHMDKNGALSKAK